MHNHSALLAGIKQLETFKEVYRLTKVSAERFEDDAQHSWHLAMACLLFRDHFPECEMERVYELALIHDLPELKTGDSNPYRDDRSNKAEDERRAMQTFCSQLPREEASRLLNLFEEYEAQQSIESRLVRGMDKLMPLISSLHSHTFHSAYQISSITYQEAYAFISRFVKDIPLLNRLFEELMEEAQEQGIFAEEK